MAFLRKYGNMSLDSQNPSFFLSFCFKTNLAWWSTLVTQRWGGSGGFLWGDRWDP